MESVNFMVCSLGQIARTMETNAMGFSQLFSSVNSLGKRVQNPFKKFFHWIKKTLLKIFHKLLVLLSIKKEMEQEDNCTNLTDDEKELKSIQD